MQHDVPMLDVLAKRQVYTPDFNKLKNKAKLYLVFLPSVAAHEIKKAGMLAGDPVRYMGEGLTSDAKYCIKKDFYGVSKDFLMFKDKSVSAHSQPRRVKAHVFAMTPRQISVLDYVLSPKDSTREYVVVKLMDQRVKSMMPFELCLSWLNNKDIQESYNRLPMLSGTMIEHRGCSELVYDLSSEVKF